ncbi:hypothetical protein ACSQ67_024186 [Phaseolus vulgaris]
MMRMAKDVEEEIKEDDVEGEKAVGKRFVGRREENGLKFSSGFNPTRKDMNRPGNLSWPNPAKIGSSFGSNANPTSSPSSTGRKSDGDRRGRASNGGGECEVRRWRNGEQRGFVLSAVMNEDGEIVALEVEDAEEEEEPEAECKIIGVRERWENIIP